MQKTWVVFSGAHKCWINGVAHKSGHCVSDLQIACCDRLALFVKGNCDVVQAFFQVGQAVGHREDRHTLRAYCDSELRLHHKSVLLASDADDNIAETLCAEIHDPTHFDPGRVNIEPPHFSKPVQLFVAIIALMLHPRGQCDDCKVVGVHNVVYVAGESQRELGHGDKEGVPASGCSFPLRSLSDPRMAVSERRQR